MSLQSGAWHIVDNSESIHFKKLHKTSKLASQAGNSVQNILYLMLVTNNADSLSNELHTASDVNAMGNAIVWLRLKYVCNYSNPEWCNVTPGQRTAEAIKNTLNKAALASVSSASVLWYCSSYLVFVCPVRPVTFRYHGDKEAV